MNFFLRYTAIEDEDYDGLLNTIAGQAPTIQSGITLDGGSSHYTDAGQASWNLLDTTYSWTITDGGYEEASSSSTT